MIPRHVRVRDHGCAQEPRRGEIHPEFTRETAGGVTVGGGRAAWRPCAESVRPKGGRRGADGEEPAERVARTGATGRAGKPAAVEKAGAPSPDGAGLLGYC
ncbi:hypothetical protein GCM10009535_11040 [Streptomyces thermocarboxydovorans]|uniref:Uncharacterized protein n=1 Tax=Streptomyces thermocarboxydovorans TaxID=59298 RepID=A0ABN1HBH8_9ACTN